MKERFTICVPRTKEELNEYFFLRWKILREPLNKEIGSEKDGMEGEAYHVCAKNISSEIVAVGRLHIVKENLENKEAQIRYMAVDDSFQGIGLGTMILRELEGLGKKNSISAIILNAREESLDFYRKNGYLVKGKSHLLYGRIQHWLMHKKI